MSSSPLTIANCFRNELCRNADVLATIFGSITVDRFMNSKERSAARKTLLSAATTCQAFRECALDALWRVIPSFIPLLQLFPSFVIMDGIYVLNNVKEEDWTLYEAYAKRVREVHFQEASPARISPFVYFQLSRARLPPNPLIPYLRVIYIAPGIDVEPTLVLSLPGPLLRCLILNDPDHNYKNHFLLSLLSGLQQSTDLAHLTLTGPQTSGVDTVMTLSQLRTLTLLLPLHQNSPSFLQALGGLQHLRELTLHAGPPRHSNNNGNPCILAALRRLKLVGHPVSMSELLQNIQPTNLDDFVVEEEEIATERSHTTPSWVLLFLWLATLPHLRSIEINQCPKRNWGHAGYSLTFKAMAQLEKWPSSSKIESLVITNRVVEVDRCPESLFASLRHLKVLRLGLTSNRRGIQSLHAVIRCIILPCPELETLQMPIDNTDALHWELQHLQRLQSQHPPHPLKELFFDNALTLHLRSQPENALKLAEYLDTLFPDLRTVLLPNRKNEEWARVENMIFTLQRARKRQSLRDRRGTTS